MDDGAQRSTQSLVDRVSQEHPSLHVRYLRAEERRGPAAARNLGWRAGFGVFVAFTDDDCVPDPHWLRAGTAALLCGADAVSGRIVVPLPPRPTDYERSAAGLESADFVTANAFVRRAALEQVGGFDETYRLAWREDSDLHFQLLSHRKTVTRSELATVVHPVRRAAWGVSLRQEHKHRFDALLQRKFPALARERLTPYPHWYYLHAAALISMLLGAIGGALSFAWFSGIVWLALTLVFACRRLADNSLRPSHILEMLVTSAVLPEVSLFWHWYGIWEFRHVSANAWSLPFRNTLDNDAALVPTTSSPLV